MERQYVHLGFSPPRFFPLGAFMRGARTHVAPAAANENTLGSKEITYNYYLLTCFLHRHDKPLQFPSHPSPFSHLKTTQREVKTEGKGKEEEVNRFEICPPPFFFGGTHVAHSSPMPMVSFFGDARFSLSLPFSRPSGQLFLQLGRGEGHGGTRARPGKGFDKY